MPVNAVPILVPLPAGCIEARFERRIKRFTIQCDSGGGPVFAHSNNTGGMLGLLRPACKMLLSPAASASRKLPWTLERVWHGPEKGGFWIGVNTLLPNRLFAAAFRAGVLPFCKEYGQLRTEARYGQSRFDLLLQGEGKMDFWLECKNATLVEDGIAAFPDAQSGRGRKHLCELSRIASAGGRAAMLYLIQRPDGACFAPADYIDEEYADLFYRAIRAGVEIYPFRAILTECGAALGDLLPVVLR